MLFSPSYAHTHFPSFCVSFISAFLWAFDSIPSSWRSPFAPHFFFSSTTGTSKRWPQPPKPCTCFSGFQFQIRKTWLVQLESSVPLQSSQLWPRNGGDTAPEPLRKRPFSEEAKQGDRNYMTANSQKQTNQEENPSKSLFSTRKKKMTATGHLKIQRTELYRNYWERRIWGKHEFHSVSYRQ